MFTLGDDDQEIVAPPGTYVYIPPGTRHSFRCGSEVGRVYNTLVPGGFDHGITTHGIPAPQIDMPAPGTCALAVWREIVPAGPLGTRRLVVVTARAVAPAAEHERMSEEPLIMSEGQDPYNRDVLMALLRAPSTCYITTLMPDGAPQLTQTWVDTDGEQIVINSVAGFQKLRNVERDPRVAVAISDPANPSRYITVRGRVTATTTDGAVDHIEVLAQKYLGGPYPWYGGRDQVRTKLTISIESLHAVGW